MLRDTIVGQKFNVNSDGILLFYDTTRSKWISASRKVVSFGLDHRGISSGRWMQMSGRVRSNTTGYKLPRNAVITAISVQSQNSATCNFRVRKNGSASNIYTLSLTAQAGKSDDNLDINLNADDWLQVLLDINSGDIDYPVLSLEIACR